MKTVRVFVSSPGDVGAEREKASEIFARLQSEFSGRVAIEPYFWEHEPMFAHTDFQSQIEPPSQFDLFVCLLWARLGTKLLPALHRKADGETYASGTEYELLDALDGFRRSGAPEVLIYKRKGFPIIPAEPKELRQRIEEQYDSLADFLDRLTKQDGHFSVAMNTYVGLEQFETKFENDMRKLLARSLPAGVNGSRSMARSWTNGSPFRGLRYFDFEHAPIFFGRTRAIDELLTSLQKQASNERAFVLVFGGSGVGKSSLVRAGVLPWLVRPGVIDGVGLWRRAVIRPGEASDGDLFDVFAAALLRAEGLPEIGADGTNATQLGALLRKNPGGAALLIKGALSQAAREMQIANNLERQPRALFALVVDQMEELFTTGRLTHQREDFLYAIDALARSGYVWIVATLRSDFYSRCETSTALMQLKQGDGQYHLQPPDEIALGQMIRLPASAAGVLFEEDHATGERLDDILRDAAVKNPAALPLLEFALEELYQQRDTENCLLKLDAYRALGGVEGALGRRAEESFTAASEKAQEKFDQIFRHLVTIGSDEGHPAVRRRADRDAVASDTASSELVERLIADRLLIIERTDEDKVVVSIAHEAMLGSWTRLAEWVALHRENLKIRGQVTTDVQRWIENNRNPDYLYTAGSPLEKAKAAMAANFLADEEAKFVKLSSARTEEQRFLASLATGKGLTEISSDLRETCPELRLDVLRNALRALDAAVRRNAAVLVGDQLDASLGCELVDLVINDGADPVRRAAGCSLIQLNKPALFDRVVGSATGDNDSPQFWRAVAELRIAADASKEVGTFDSVFRKLDRRSRSRIKSQGARLRLRRGAPLLLLISVPAILFACVAASAFKWLPGSFNFALSQAAPNAAMGVFHAITAAVIWGGSITLGVALYFIVFGRESARRSFLQPIGAIISGLIAGAISSVAITLLIVTVYTNQSLALMGWTTEDYDKFSLGLWKDLFVANRFGWPFLLMGTSLGVGMALMTNGLRASKRWNKLLNEQSALTNGHQVLQLIRSLVKLGLRYAWPVPMAVSVGCLLAFAVLRSAPLTTAPQTSALIAQLSDRGRAIREWKLSPVGEALGIAGDGITQVIGGTFAIIGMGLAIVIARYGIKVEPQRN
jgi:hypothetical protein